MKDKIETNGFFQSKIARFDRRKDLCLSNLEGVYFCLKKLEDFLAFYRSSW